MRVLFASTQGAGHFGPLIPFIDACTRGGHEALIVGPPTLKSRGYPFEAGASLPDDVIGPLWGRMPSLPPAQGDVVVVGTIFARLNVDAMLPMIDETIAGWQPDLVVREAAEFASGIAAERHGVPCVRVAIGFAQFEETSLAIAAPGLEARQRGIVERIRSSPFLSYYPASIDPSSFEVSRFRDPARDGERQPLPDWWPGDERPLVYISFGSVAATIPPAAQVYANALAAVADLSVRALLTTGGNEVELGEVPANVHVEQWVSEPDVLAGAAAAVGHGGTGTTLSALAAGCPLVVVPLFADQPLNAAQVAVVGAGVVASVDTIRESIELVLADDRYRVVVGRIADEMRALPPVDAFFAGY